MPRSKRYQKSAKLIDKDKLYPVADAIKLAKQTAKTKFDGSIEVHFRLGIDPKKGEQQVRGTVVLPHGTGKTKKIIAFVSEGKVKEAQDAGADIIGTQEIIDKIKQTGKIDFEVAIATPDMMPKLAAIAKILGPKGLMPSPKSETITTDLKKTIEALKKGKVNFKNDDTGNIHQIIGRTSFDEKKLIENFKALFDAIRKAKPGSAKGIYIKNISINATMGPGIKIEIPS
jgi:large subunit ribosomal protein L1